MYLYIHIIIYLCQRHPVIHYIYRSMSFCCLLYISGPVAHLLIYILFGHLLYIFISPTDCILFAHIYTVLNSPSLFSLLILYSSSYTTCHAHLYILGSSLSSSTNSSFFSTIPLCMFLSLLSLLTLIYYVLPWTWFLTVHSLLIVIDSLLNPLHSPSVLSHGLSYDSESLCFPNSFIIAIYHQVNSLLLICPFLLLPLHPLSGNHYLWA